MYHILIYVWRWRAQIHLQISLIDRRYVVILIKTLQKWRAEHDGKAPTTRDEKDAFKKLVEKQSKSDKEDNFREAVKAALKAWTPTRIPDDVKDIYFNYEYR